MTKEEYIKEMKDILVLRRALNLRESNLKNTYISDNREFSLDDKVKVSYADGYTIEAFVDGCGIHDDGELYYSLKAVKSNGAFRDCGKTLTLIEAAKPTQS
jgi:hypothetical protein